MLFVIIFHLFRVFHPFFVSITEIKHNDKAKSLEISSKVFFNDLEDALEKKYHQQLDILKPTEKTQITPLLQDYLQKHLQIKVNGKATPLKLIGYEIEEDAVWCYLEAPKVNQIKKMEIRNDVLFAEHDSQTNMLHLTVKGQRQSTKLDNPTHTAAFTFR
jgi:hypothetical protein